MMPLSCAASSASAISSAMRSASSSGILPRAIRVASSSPEASSITSARWPAVLLEPVDRGDVGMVERGEHLRLALEATHDLRVLGQRFGDELERDVAMEAAVGRPVDDSHAALAELLDDGVAADALPDHAVSTSMPLRSVRSWSNQRVTSVRC